MIKSVIGFAVGAGLCLAGSVASAEPIKLKFAFRFSDATSMFSDMIKPFVEAVNAEARDAVRIEVYPSGALGKDPSRQAQMVLDGTADFAFAVPSAGTRFADDAVVELPGVYHGMREASLVYTRLAAAGVLRGMSDFYVVGAFGGEPENIHSRRPIASLDDLKGQKIRTSSPLQSAAFAKLGMEPVMMPTPAVTAAITGGVIDGAAVTSQVLHALGIGRMTSYHYMLRTSASPLTILMNRKTFESLPASAQAAIRRYSGEWLAVRFADCCEQTMEQTIDQLKTDPRRKVVIPTQSDVDRVQAAFTSVIDDWAAKDQHNQDLLRLVRAELSKLRATRESKIHSNTTARR